jgi:putative ABC transport system permease protein
MYGVLPDVPLRNVATMEQVIGRQMATRRLSMLLLGLFGVLGLAIAAAGIYGLLAYFVSQRSAEFGIRIALGATPASIIAMVLLHTCTLVVSGLVIGSAAAWYLSAASKTFLFRVEPTDWRAYAVAMAVLVCAAVVASIIPARRAASVDPVEALRHR